MALHSPARRFSEDESSPTSLPVSDDAALAARIRAGETPAFDHLFTLHCSALVSFAAGYVRSTAIAQEIVQEVFCRIWIDRVHLAPATTLRAYLYTAVRHQALNQLRHWQVEERLATRATASAEEVPVPGMAETLAQADAGLLGSEWSPAVRKAVAALSEQQRRVLALRAEHGLTYREIAVVLGLSIKTVETQAARGIKALRAALS